MITWENSTGRRNSKDLDIETAWRKFEDLMNEGLKRFVPIKGAEGSEEEKASTGNQETDKYQKQTMEKI